MIKLKELIKEEVIEKLLSEDSESDEKQKVTYDYNGKEHEIQRNTALQYARKVSMGDDDVTDQMKAAVQAFPDIAQQIGLDTDANKKKDDDDEPGKIKGRGFDREADKDDEKEKLQKQIEDLEDKIQTEMELVARGTRDEEDVMALVNKLDDLEAKLADMD